MTVDLRSVPVQVVVGGLDLSPAFVQLSIGAGTWDDSGWFKPRGQLELAAYWDGQPESFDCRDNPARWAPGTVVAISVDLGAGWVALPWRLRILAYPNRPYPGQPTITLELGGDADLLNYRAPEGDPGTDEYGTPTGATTLINRALAKAGAPTLTDTVTGLSLPFSPEKNTGGSWMTYAGQVAYAARHILWQQADGAIRAVPFDLDALTTPVAAYTVGTNEADYIPEAPGEQPPEVVKVQGTTYEIEVVKDESFVTTDIVDGVTVRTTVTYRDRGTYEPVYIEQVEQPAGVVLPNIDWVNPSVMIVDSRLTKTQNYNIITARLDAESELTERPAAFVFPDANWLNPGNLIDAEQVTVEYSYDSDDVLKERRTTIERSVRTGTTAQLAKAQITIERWTKVGAEEYTFQRTQTNFDETQPSLPERRGASTNNTPPATTYRPAEKQRTEKQFSGQARFTSPAGSGFAEKLWSLQLPSGMGVSATQCRRMAEHWGKIRQGRQFPIKWAADLTSAWLTSFNPVQRMDFTLGGVTTSYLVEALQLVITQRDASVGGKGIELGRIVGGVVNPPYQLFAEIQVAIAAARAGAAVVGKTPVSGSVALSANRAGVLVEGAIGAAVTVAAQRAGIAVAGSTASPLLTNLIAWYSLNEASGNRADSHAGGYTLTQNGTVNSTTGRVGNAASFSGNSANFLSQSGSQFNFGNSTFYCATWVFSIDTSLRNIASVWDENANRQWNFDQFSGKYRFYLTSDGLFGAGNFVVVETATYTANQWNFVEFYYNAVSDLAGIALNNGSFVTGAFSKGVFPGASTPFRIGRIASTVDSNPFNGRVDEFAVWSRMLTAGERTTLYNGGNGIAYPG